MTHFRSAFLLFLFAGFRVSFLSLAVVPGHSPPDPVIDSLIRKTCQTFNVPGIAVGVVKDGKIVYTGSYGVRSLKTGKGVDENTLFGVASNSKAFTAAALAILVDEGKLGWDDKVRDHIPEFVLYDPWVTAEFTIRDLLTHRSGLGLGAGDLMMFPDSNRFSREDIIRNLRYLRPVSSFRSRFDYNNNLYIVAGEVVARVSGISWEDFIEKRILAPLGMNRTSASMARVRDRDNLISPHAPVNGKVEAITIDWSETANAAGGLVSSVSDMCRWMRLQLDEGRYGDSLQKRLFSEEQHREMWMPQMPVRSVASPPYHTRFSSYGLGWFLADVKGMRQVSHTGGLAGVVTQVTLIPELELGIVVLTNQQSGAAFSAITNTLKDRYLGAGNTDWIKRYRGRADKMEKEAGALLDSVDRQIRKQSALRTGKPDFARYAGSYRDDWFGTVKIETRNGKPWLTCLQSPRLSGELHWYKGNCWVVRWKERSFDADAWVNFSLDEEGRGQKISMKAISPLTDFSFDFHDLDLKRVDENSKSR